MKRLIQILFLVLFALSFVQCNTYNINKLKNNRKVIAEAYDNKQLVSLYFHTSSNEKPDSMVAGFIKSYDSGKDLFSFKSLNSKKEMELLVKYDIDSVSFINNEDKIRLSLTDNSVFIGEISDSNIADNSITFKTQHKKYTIPGSKISEIKLFDVNRVKLIFLDGTEIFGSIVKDDGNNIYLKTILGDESYPRKDILRIDYVK